MLCLSACRLDSNLFNPKTITEYKLDDYDGDVRFKIGEEYNIADSLIHVFTLTSDDNGNQAEIYAIYLGDISQIATDTVIMYCHGNSSHMDVYWERMKLLANVGGKNRFGLLAIDYRGYGLSEGESSESSLYADVDAALAWLKDQGLTDDRLAIYGFSLGGAPSCELTANPRSLAPSWLMLEAAFASSEVMAEGATTLSVPSSFLTNLEIDNAEEIKTIEEPFLWFHGTIDDFIDFETHGEVVANNYQGSYIKRVPVEGAGHSDLPAIMGYEAYNQTVLEFLTR